MNKEVEYKFIVNIAVDDFFENMVPLAFQEIQQGYLVNDNETKTVLRVRTTNYPDQKERYGFITVKGPSGGKLVEKYEYEMPIPYEYAETFLKSCDRVLSKTRYLYEYAGKVWEVDKFNGRLQGLIIAELEVKDENETFERPEWAVIDVTEYFEFSNNHLIKCDGIPQIYYDLIKENV